jgi:predicted HNH restriction endonuclease
MSKYNRQYYEKHREEKARWQKEHRPKLRERQRRRKQEFVMQKGGKCEKCGYDSNYAVLGFHHLNGRKVKGKRQELASENPQTDKFNIDEVVLVCSNCHGEIHHPEFQILKVSP